ncbi:hypothetical protein [Psychromonas sp. KJ10-2]|uniref:hypothetical protein n=1 Tax=Psychromonas sp. KJ10-2 TaxID=3391822 RepID=UPI0039B6D7DC
MNKLILVALLSLINFNVLAEDEVDIGECQDAGVLTGQIITDTPWESMYPIRLLGTNVSPTGSGAPDEATSDIVCSCEDDLGIYIPGLRNQCMSQQDLLSW